MNKNLKVTITSTGVPRSEITFFDEPDDAIACCDEKFALAKTTDVEVECGPDNIIHSLSKPKPNHPSQHEAELALKAMKAIKTLGLCRVHGTRISKHIDQWVADIGEEYDRIFRDPLNSPWTTGFEGGVEVVVRRINGAH